MTVDELFTVFGGREVVQDITKVTRNAANNWRHEGVPFKYWHILVGAAAERGIKEVTFEALGDTRQTAA